MQFKNTNTQFGIITIALHWLVAIIMIGLIILGLVMTRIPLSPFKLELFRWHKEFGMIILMLFFVRIAWRIYNALPSLMELPLFERVAARSVHWSFYIFMFILPLSGWLLTSASGIPVSFFGWFVFPDFITSNEISRIFWTNIHAWLAYALIVVVCMHVAAALKHHFINKDDILRRMLWP